MVAVTLGPEKKEIFTVESEKLKLDKNENAEANNTPFSFYPQMDSFLMCLSVRTGTLIVGWYYAVLYFILASCLSYIFLISIVRPDLLPEDATPENLQALGLDGSQGAIFYQTWLAMNVIACIALLIGVYKRKALLLRPFMVMWCSELIYLIVCAFYQIDILFSLCEISIKTYLLLVVNSHHTELQNQIIGYTIPI